VAHVVQQEWREQSPSLHAALPGLGWRIQAAGPPQAPGITMALRKHPQQIYTLEQYVHQGILSSAQDAVLRAALAQKQRLLISGATGSAKTSLANACLDVLRDSEERLVILEDDPELICTVRNAMFLRTRPGLSMTDLVKESLRYRPDRIIVGEIRDGAARAMCRAFETGHSGLATVHAESALGTLSRLEGLMQEGGAPPECALIGSVIDLIIHMERSARSLTCTAMVAVDGYDGTQYQTRRLA